MISLDCSLTDIILFDLANQSRALKETWGTPFGSTLTVQAFGLGI